MKSVALPGIRLAQRWISPRKRFPCAYRVHTGNASCSWLGYRAIRRFGVWQGGHSCGRALTAVPLHTGNISDCTCTCVIRQVIAMVVTCRAMASIA